MESLHHWICKETRRNRPGNGRLDQVNPVFCFRAMQDMPFRESVIGSLRPQFILETCSTGTKNGLQGRGVSPRLDPLSV